ncbi:hypothetical protein MLD38_007140 [Melastoma candidum]|uniref:Uncharacterized protein n=1 Tax=Melastoma candidum TaxID=119954 RepID=A0ACB9RYP6_9MYRT|nr:hypothetical protein MLD38_007140 [Melastoma candidum]
MVVVSHGSSLPLLLSFLILNHVPLTHQKLEENHTQAGRVSAASLFIFGDSFLDAGNNNYINTTTLDQANFWPYGETFFCFPTGRFSDGRLPSDFIAEFAGLPLILPYLQPGAHEWRFGANFASAGAGALVGTFQGSVIDLETHGLLQGGGDPTEEQCRG